MITYALISERLRRHKLLHIPPIYRFTQTSTTEVGRARVLPVSMLRRTCWCSITNRIKLPTKLLGFFNMPLKYNRREPRLLDNTWYFGSNVLSQFFAKYITLLMKHADSRLGSMCAHVRGIWGADFGTMSAQIGTIHGSVVVESHCFRRPLRSGRFVAIQWFIKPMIGIYWIERR